MVENRRVLAADVRGVNRLTLEETHGRPKFPQPPRGADDVCRRPGGALNGIAGVVDLVEAMHDNIATIPGILPSSKGGRTTGITRLVYRSIHGVVGLAGHGLYQLLTGLAPLLLAQLERMLHARRASPRREALLAALNGVLNGVLGDYLAASNNSLAISMRLHRGGIALPDEGRSLAAAIPEAGGKLVVLLHGLCMNDLQWKRKGHDHGAALARDLGYTPVYLHYNRGLHISVNGRAFAELLEALAQRWPVPLTEPVLIGHSMGGLVACSAWHYGALARHEWLRHLDKIVFLGTPEDSPFNRHFSRLLGGQTRHSTP